MRRVLVLGLDAILVALAVATIVTYGARMLGSRPKPVSSVPNIKSGEPLAIQGLPSGRALVLATSLTCPYCRKSLPFHQELIARSRKANIPVVIVAPERQDPAEHLQKLNLPPGSIQVINVDLRQSHIAGTPTILLLDASHHVQSAWVGALSQDREETVLAAVSGGPIPAGQTRHPEGLRDADLAGIESAVVIDPRDRSQFKPKPRTPGVASLNIPIDELYARASEIVESKGRPVLDCESLSGDLCERAARDLRSRGVKGLLLMNVTEGVPEEKACVPN